MKNKNDRDEALRSLFREARRVDRERTPEFHQVLGATRTGKSGSIRPLRLLAVAVATCTGALAMIVVADGWIRESTPRVFVAQRQTAARPLPVPRPEPVPAGESSATEETDVVPQSPPPDSNVTAAVPPPPAVARITSPVPEPYTRDALEDLGELNRKLIAGAPEPLPTSELVQRPVPNASSPTIEGRRSRNRRSVGATGGLSVVVTDESGDPLPRSIVTISHETGSIKTTSERANKQGVVKFPVLRPGGGYSIEVSFPGGGFATIRQDKLRVKSSENITIPVTMQDEFEESVRVVCEADVIDLDTTASSTRSSDATIADLPVPGRFYQNVLTMSPGVRDTDGNPVVHGSRQRDFQAVVSGVSNVDPLIGLWMSRVNPNSIEEMEVITSGAGLVYGHDPRPPVFNTEAYDVIHENGFLSVRENPLSTFSIDVDTASYSNARRFIRSGVLPPKDAVRIEEFINYFNYEYPEPRGNDPFSVSVEIADCPWKLDHRLVRVGLKGREVSRDEHEGLNLVFLIDVSGSMARPNKLPLLVRALKALVRQLDVRDRVAIVVYASSTGLVLPSTPSSRRQEILEALDRLQAGGSTNGGAGIQLAYRVARKNFIEAGVNRVILATDGDFNVGVTSKGQLLQLIENDARKGIFLTVLGFGMGNFKDDRLEELSGRGNGNYAYIDTFAEARKVLVEELSGTLIAIAKDVKVQIEFNPLQVGAYRLIGYENRMLRKEDFNDDRKDAGEIGSGHTVTALYELAPPDVKMPLPPVDDLRYQVSGVILQTAESGELLTLKLRYKEPDEDTSQLLSYPIVDEGHTLASASEDFKFAAAVAEFGMVLRDSAHKGDARFSHVQALSLEGIGADPTGRRDEFHRLVTQAAAIAGGDVAPSR